MPDPTGIGDKGKPNAKDRKYPDNRPSQYATQNCADPLARTFALFHIGKLTSRRLALYLSHLLV
ncbi:MAG: hypothetical protein AAGK00_15865 [Pseudomonadota bacterium]